MAWTREQQKAIDTRDKTLLVSAAAGSGKTATLTERIIRSILDEKNPADIGRMLIATYTNAAVDELRERIGKAIKKAAVENPENTRLEQQLLKLKDAKILTITSFCNSILRSSAESIGLSPNYRIAEPAEAKILSSSILEGLINSAYENDIPEVCSAEDFIELADCLSNIKFSEGLGEAIAYIFEKLTYTEHGIDTLIPFVNEYNPENFSGTDSSYYGKYIVSHIKNAFSEYESAYEKLIGMASGEKVDEKNLPKALNDLEYIRICLSKNSYRELSEQVKSFSPERLSRSGKDPITDFYQNFKVLRSFLGDDVKTFCSDFLVYSEQDWLELYTKLYKLFTTLYRFLKKYYSVFSEEKRRRAICEFSDVERYAYNALYNKDGTVTDLALELREKFDSIYVDEYQDVNGLQGKIFSAIAKENNRFMVGDIKQSIYGFRSARPEIFKEMKNAFPSIEEQNDSPCASIFMSNNFRCDECVVDFVNGVFDTTFGLLGKSIGYVESDRLEFSKIYPEGSSPVKSIPEIHIIEKPSKDKKDENEDDAVEKIIDEDTSSAKMQAVAIAKKVKELIANAKLANGKNVEAHDIAILMRSVKGNLAAAISEELSKIGIPSDIAEIQDLFMCEDVLLALSFLYCIDNPRKDVYLTAVMMSPMFKFTADEILKIRKSSDKEYLWEALTDFSENEPENKKVTAFIKTILKYRKLAEGEPADSLLSMIFREYGLIALASKNGGKENLMLLHSYARKFESTDFKGLYSFISYVNAIIERGEEFSSASSTEAGGVKIMTVHKSKGLEFPVTILAGASSKTSGAKDSKIAFCEDFGICLKAKDDSGLAIVENPVFNSICHYIKKREFDEELRVLYVALTRAREYLYIYASSPKSEAEEYTDFTESVRSMLSPYFMSKAKSFLDIIMFSRANGKLFVDSSLSSESEPENDDSCEKESIGIETEKQTPSSAVNSNERDKEIKEMFLSRFTYEYPLSIFETVPEKVSVSKLSPVTLDGEDQNAFTLEDLLLNEEFYNSNENEDQAPPKKTFPKFISGQTENESAKRGIATHTVLQFCDFEKLLENGTESELARLENEEYISKDDRARVRVSEIDKFVKSDLFKKIRGAKHLYREFRFNVKLPAENFTCNEEKKQKLKGNYILVQGVIDCLIENEDGSLHLVDYKTDRLTKDELQTPKLAEERLINSHKLQLSYYGQAVERIFKKKPSKIGIYSLHLGKEIFIHY